MAFCWITFPLINEPLLGIIREDWQAGGCQRRLRCASPRQDLSPSLQMQKECKWNRKRRENSFCEMIKFVIVINLPRGDKSGSQTVKTSLHTSTVFRGCYAHLIIKAASQLVYWSTDVSEEKNKSLTFCFTSPDTQTSDFVLFLWWNRGLAGEDWELSLKHTWASTSRCLIRVMDFLSVSLSPGTKASSSSVRLQGLVTMNWAIWSFKLLSDWTAAKEAKIKFIWSFYCRSEQ